MRLFRYSTTILPSSMIAIFTILVALNSANADEYKFFTKAGAYDDLTPEGGVIHGVFVSDIHQFDINIILSPITPLVFGDYYWKPHPQDAVSEYLSMNDATVSVPFKNRNAYAQTFEGTAFSDNAPLWLTKQYEAGNMDLVYEFTVTIGSLPDTIQLIDGSFNLVLSSYAAGAAGVYQNGCATRFVDENGDFIDALNLDVSFGESVKIQMGTFSRDHTTQFVYLFYGQSTIEAEAIPEVQSAILLGLSLGLTWMISVGRGRYFTFKSS